MYICIDEQNIYQSPSIAMKCYKQINTNNKFHFQNYKLLLLSYNCKASTGEITLTLGFCSVLSVGLPYIYDNYRINGHTAWHLSYYLEIIKTVYINVTSWCVIINICMCRKCSRN